MYSKLKYRARRPTLRFFESRQIGYPWNGCSLKYHAGNRIGPGDNWQLRSRLLSARNKNMLPKAIQSSTKRSCSRLMGPSRRLPVARTLRSTYIHISLWIWNKIVDSSSWIWSRTLRSFLWIWSKVLEYSSRHAFRCFLSHTADSEIKTRAERGGERDEQLETQCYKITKRNPFWWQSELILLSLIASNEISLLKFWPASVFDSKWESRKCKLRNERCIPVSMLMLYQYNSIRKFQFHSQETS